MTETEDRCSVGGRNDGTLRVCCSTHGKTLCAHHYARTHFVETMPEFAWEFSCTNNPVEKMTPTSPLWRQVLVGVAGGLVGAGVGFGAVWAACRWMEDRR